MKENTMSHAPVTEPSGRHPVNIGHLVMGLAFVGLVGVWALIQGDVVQGDDIRWLLPLPWVLAGIAGLLAAALNSRHRRTDRQTGWVGPGSAGYAGPESGPESGPAWGPESGLESGTGYAYDATGDWTIDNPYDTTHTAGDTAGGTTDTPEETR
jgi:hypothetical protein